MNIVCKYFIPHPYKHTIHVFTALYLKKLLVLYNFEFNKNPVNEAETEREIFIVYYTSIALEILGMKTLFALISSSVT